MEYGLTYEEEKKMNLIKDHVRKIEYLRSTNNNLLYWDKITNMPAKGIDYRAEVMSYFAGEIHKLSEDSEFIKLVEYFDNKDPESLDIKTLAMIRKIKRNQSYINKIPVEEYKEYINLITRAEEVWSSLSDVNHFETMKPYLEKIIEHMRNFASYWGYDEEPYNAFLSYYETGVDVDKVDKMFQEIKVFVIDMLSRIKSSDVKIKKDIFQGSFPGNSQKEMTMDLLKRIGFDFQAGRLDEGIHPTLLVSSNKDVRLVTKYCEDDFRPALTTALHQGGQALYEQGISEDLYGTLLAESSSLVMLEAVARFYESIFGKSKEFWNFYFPRIQELYPQLLDVEGDTFLKAINAVEPSLVRMDADELTYNLHIIIRYEIEKALINGEIQVEEVSNAWNQKYQDYLGVAPLNDKLGVLQDVHWFSGYFGYFPCYVLGNIYASQISIALKSQIEDYESLVERGCWDQVNKWFRENLFSYGAVHGPQELVYLITDENLKSEYYIDYLRSKYNEIYEI